MDRPISEREQRNDRRKRWWRLSLIPILLLLAFWLLKTFISPSAQKDDFRIATIELGDMESTVSASGLILPAYEVLLNAPITADIKAAHFRNGDRIRTGDLILELDAEITRLNYEQLRNQLELKKNNVGILKLKYDKNLQDLEADDTIMSLRLNNLESLLRDEQNLQSIGGSSAENLEQAQMKLEIARWEKRKLENELAFQKKSLPKEKYNLELEVQIQDKKLKELGKKVNETQVKAPQEGVITWINRSIGKKVNEGEELVRLADLSAFRVEASFSDLHSEKVKTGMEVKVRINKTDLKGHIESILPEIENNMVKCNIALENDAHELLRPNMRVEVFIITARKTNVLRVVNGPAFTGGRQQNLFVINGRKAIRRRVTIGLQNSDFVELSGNIKAGDRIIVSNMKDYDHLEELKLSDS